MIGRVSVEAPSERGRPVGTRRVRGRSGMRQGLPVISAEVRRTVGRPWHPVSALFLLLLAGCGGRQSMLGTANPAAGEIELLWWIALGSTGTLSMLVFLALGYAVVRARRAARADAPGEDIDRTRQEVKMLLLAGLVVPAAFLIGFLTLSVRTGSEVSTPPEEPVLTVEVVGRMFWWEVRYPDAGVVTANEIHIPVGEPVALRVSSADVIHSFWVPQLTPGKIDMVPGRTNLFWMLADEPGDYRGQCTEFCGVQHALMSLLVTASPREEFEGWLERRATAPEPPSDAQQVRGQALFFQRGCGACHAVGDAVPTEGLGTVGPRLDDVGSRQTLGALSIENTPDNLARWITDPHQFKPGVRMPATLLEPNDLDALVAYLLGMGS